MGRKICVCLSICELANAAQMRQIASQTAGPSAKRCGAWCCSRLASESVWGNADVHSADRGIAKRKFAWNVLPKHCMPQPENHRLHARCRHTHLWQWVAWMVRPNWLHRPHNPHREGHLSRVGVEGLFLLAASWQTKYGESERDNCLRGR